MDEKVLEYLENKEIIDLKGFAQGAKMYQTIKAIYFAIKSYRGQYRKDDPKAYITHPARVANSILCLGYQDDESIAAYVLLDVVEDCKVTYRDLRAAGFSNEVIKIVSLLTKTKNISEDMYYLKMREDPRAILGKGGDRSHNIATMAGAFSPEKMRQYVKESEDFVIPLLKYGRSAYPEFNSYFNTQKYHIESICNTIKSILDNIKGEV